MANQIKTPKWNLQIEGQSITRLTYAQNVVLAIEDVPNLASDLRKMRDFIKTVLILSDIRKVKSSSKEFRDYISNDLVIGICNAIAVLISSPLSKTMGNLYIKLNKPVYQIRLFSKENDAITLLKSFEDRPTNL